MSDAHCISIASQKVKRMNKSLLPFIVATVFISATLNAQAANDPYVGEYVGNCPGAQCFIEITKKKGKNYHLRFTAADRMNAKKILCRADIPMGRGKLDFTARIQYPDALFGEYKADPLVWLLAFDNGTIDFYVENAPCGRFEMSGEYIEFGDE